jgi:hypothetical protein
VRFRPPRRFDHLFHDVLWRGPVGIPHAEVDNVFSASPRSRLQFTGDVKDIRGQSANTWEFVHGNLVAAPGSAIKRRTAPGSSNQSTEPEIFSSS